MRHVFLIVATLTLVACQATYNAGIRRNAEARLKSCRHGLQAPVQLRGCYDEVKDYCRSKGLERTCGEGAP